jgi:hypothetical protein
MARNLTPSPESHRLDRSTWWLLALVAVVVAVARMLGAG